MRTSVWLRRSAAAVVSLVLVSAMTYGGAASAADVGFSVDDFAGNSMGTRTVVPGNNTCTPSGNNSVTMGTGTMRVDLNVPDSIGCNYANGKIAWTAPTSVDIEQNGADRIILKYRDVVPNQPSAVTFGLELVDVNGRTASVGGLTRNGGPAGDFLTIRYTPAYVGDVAVLSFQSGFDRAHVKSVTLLVAATTSYQNVSVTFDGIGTNVGEPSYELPIFGNAAAYEFAPNTSTTHTFTVTGNPAPDVSWTGKPSWMSISTSGTAGGTLVTMSGNPGTAYADSSIAFHADVANSLTADANVRVVVPSPVALTYTTTNKLVNNATPLTLGTVSSTPGSAVLGSPTGLPAGTTFAVSGGNVILSGTPTATGTYTVSATIGNEFRSAAFTRQVVIGQTPGFVGPVTKNFVRGTPITPFTLPITGYPAPTVTFDNLPAGLTAVGGVISGTPTTTSSNSVGITAYNDFAFMVSGFTINVGDAPTVVSPSGFSVLADSPVSTPVAVTGAPTSFTATGLPAGLSTSFVGGVARIVGTPSVPTSAATASGTAQLTVTNAFGSDTETMDWTVDAVPTVSGPTEATVALGDPFSPVVIDFAGYPAPTATAEDIDGDGRLLPAGLTIDDGTAGRIRIIGTPTGVDTQIVRINVSNGVGNTVYHDVTISIVESPVFADDAPVLTLRQGTLRTLDISPSGYPKPTLTLLSSLPAWLSFNAATGVFTADPSAPVEGAFGPFEVRATNTGGTATAQVLVHVTAAPTLPDVVARSAERDVAVRIDLGSVTGYPVPTVTASGLPAGLSLEQNGASLEVVGTATADGGDYAVTLTADNGISAPVARGFTLQLLERGTVSVPAGVTFQLGEPALLEPTVVGFPRPQVIVAGLPDGLTSDPATGAISGVPTATGTYVVDVMLFGGYLSQMTPVSLTITVASDPAFSPAPTAATVRLGAAVDLVAFGVSGYPTPTATAAGLPSGLSLAQSGTGVQLVGTPTESGVFVVDVTLESIGGTLEDSWTITVEDPAQVDAPASAVVNLGQAITPIPLTTSGYPAPTVTASGLPAGLEVVSDEGGTRIEGTPTEDGSYTVGLVASNGVGVEGSDSITIDVQSAPSLGDDIVLELLPGEMSHLTLPVTGFPAPTLDLGASTGAAFAVLSPGTGEVWVQAGDLTPGATGSITVTATSAAGSDSVTIRVTTLGAPAVAASGGTTTVSAGDAVNATLTTVTGYPEPSVTAVGLPTGLSVAVVGGEIALTGTTAAAGSHAVTLTLDNGVGADLVVPWTVVVEAPAAVTPLPDAMVTLGDDVTIPVGVAGYPAPTVTVGGLPDGLAWVPGPGGGSIVGTPAATGTSVVTIEADNGIGGVAVETLTLTVDLPVIDLSLSAGSVKAGEFIAIDATGFLPNEEVTVTLHSTPVLLATLHADASGVLSAQVRIPADTEAGSHTIIVEGANGATASAGLTVTAADDELSGTGADSAGIAGIALLLLVAGAGAVVIARRGGALRV